MLPGVSRSAKTPQGQTLGGDGSELSTHLVEDASEFESLRSNWDALAVSARAPFGAPAWAEAWWRHLAPAGARLAVVAVHAGAELVGLAPFYATRQFGVTELRLLSGGWASRLGILAAPGFEARVTDAVARALFDADWRPDIVHWEAVDVASQWPESMSAAWPDGRAHLIREESQRSAPVLHLGQGSYEEWFAGKSSSFRREMRRHRRKIEEEDVTFRCADRVSLERDLTEFEQLHSARWNSRGGSSAVNPGAMAALREVGEALVEAGRFRLWMIDAPNGEAVSVQVAMAAGGVVALWNTGFDERWRKYSPGVLTVLAAVEDAFERGDETVDLGGGEAAYKERLADEDLPVTWRTSYLRGPRYPLARLRRFPEQAARRGSHTLREWLGSDRLNRVRGFLGR